MTRAHRLRLLRRLFRPSAASRRHMQRRRWIQRWADTQPYGPHGMFSWWQGERNHPLRVRARRRKERR